MRDCPGTQGGDVWHGGRAINLLLHFAERCGIMYKRGIDVNEKIYSIEEIKSRVSPIAMRYGVERVYLFGSYAKGCATAESDIDLRVDKGSLRGLFALSGMRLDICDSLSKNVDLLTTNSLDDSFRSKIHDDEVLIYCRNG